MFFSSSVVLQVILLITCSLLPSPFCSSAFYLKEFSLLPMPCHVAAAFDLWKHKQKPSHMSDSREDVNMLFTERKRKLNTDIFEMKTEHLQYQEVCI